jgi:DNA-binding response OmpR family regulator
MTASNPSSEPDAAAAGRVILIVDDEPSVRMMVRTSIGVKASRYVAIEAGSASEALQKAEQQRPELVLLDVALPDHDGFWVCRQLKSNPRTAHMIVVMLTAMGLSSDRDSALEAGADGYIVKPFSPRALLEELDHRLP